MKQAFLVSESGTHAPLLVPERLRARPAGGALRPDLGSPRPLSATPAEVARLLAVTGASEQDAAWSAFLESYSSLMLRTARSLGGDHDAVMDRYAFVLGELRQEDFRRLRSYDRPGAGEFRLWLVVVVRRLCLDHHRARYGRTRPPTAAASSPAAERATRRRLVDLVADRVDPSSLPTATRESPEEAVVRTEWSEALAAVLDGLAPRDRLLLRLRFAEELSAREIARVMEFPTLFHVYRRLDAVLAGLRAALMRAGIDGTGA